MKMAKASEADLNMAIRLCEAFESLNRYGHMIGDDEDDEPVSFDIDSSEDCKRALHALFDIYETGSLMRVVWGMAVLLDPSNEIVDPDSDVLEVHPKFAAAPDLLEAAQACVLWYANRDPKRDQPYPIENQPPEIQRAMAAIAKATGEAA